MFRRAASYFVTRGIYFVENMNLFSFLCLKYTDLQNHTHTVSLSVSDPFKIRTHVVNTGSMVTFQNKVGHCNIASRH
jgi:hypothetical protein